MSRPKEATVRFSRPCYDKPHRCPGWAGGGMKYPRGESRCNNGRIRTRVEMKEFPGEYEYPASTPWRFGHCDTCDVVTWPWALSWPSRTFALRRLRRKCADFRCSWAARDLGSVIEPLLGATVCRMRGHRWGPRMRDAVCTRCYTSCPRS